MENKTYQAAAKFVDQMIEIYGPKYSSVYKAILNNCVNSNYARSSNEFVTCVWQVLNTKFQS
jgi:hypothetical protein